MGSEEKRSMREAENNNNTRIEFNHIVNWRRIERANESGITIDLPLPRMPLNSNDKSMAREHKKEKKLSTIRVNSSGKAAATELRFYHPFFRANRLLRSASTLVTLNWTYSRSRSS